MSSVAINAIQELRQDDIIIAFMGPTGVGKSYFIDLLTGEVGKRSGHTLKSVTADIQATRIKNPITGLYNVVLVDTPGFDDTTRSDMEILTMISVWLGKTYKKDVKLSGLVYLHRITDNRMAGAPYKNLRMFGNLCGDSATSRVVLVSTMWERVNPDVGNQREAQLRDVFWKPLIDNGSGVERLRESKSAEAWRIVGDLIRKHKEREAVLLQEELVDLERQLKETEAGKTLYTTLQKHLADQRDSLKSLLTQVEKSGDPKLKKELEKEYKKIQDQFQKTFNEVNKLKVPLGRRIQMFFFGKKTHAKAIKINETDK